MYYHRDLSLSWKTYLFGAAHDLLEEVDVGGGEWRQVGVAVVDEEEVHLLLRLALAAELAHLDAAEVRVLHHVDWVR